VTVSYFVRYEIAPADEKAFLEHYRTRHVPILARWPGIRRVVLHTAAVGNDAFPVERGGSVLLAQLEFDSQADLQAALNSPQRAEARRDFEKFPLYEGTVTHQAMTSDEAWRRDA
jgi:uncharacterized protein (TIGR02118 family)